MHSWDCCKLGTEITTPEICKQFNGLHVAPMNGNVARLKGSFSPILDNQRMQSGLIT
ncbi:hypothetical protein IT6_02615 [Methylacidiphilum caldifontis]|uniref:hypothetical protein n=1 Tax=Methylacidiphilum caldifontis TaxID=2795386 RepID=UPI001A8CD199|nr:hypothetical protein [Methylacidiphilum caldifontis]QSR89197.1 hypothetical protein IT6_02615 [Methylacidiphilum caldifontis]